MKLKERFEVASDDFTLDRQGLKDFFHSSSREIEIIFEFFDLNQDGRIDSYEFVCAMTLLSHATLEEKAKLLF
jgi:Ca2+-binding EF-hand superfamily protein